MGRGGCSLTLLEPGSDPVTKRMRAGFEDGCGMAVTSCLVVSGPAIGEAGGENFVVEAVHRCALSEKGDDGGAL